MTDFLASEVWGFINLVAILLASLLLANTLKRKIKFIRRSLIPTSVLGGALLLIISLIYESITGASVFDTAYFGGNGTATLEMITYHALALGFIASTLKSAGHTMTGKAATDVFNSGVTTVSTYLLQAILGMGITLLIALAGADMFSAGGLLLPFGFGQGTGQAMNWGNIYETEHGFIGGKSFGLTVAALGFISASTGGVIYLNYMKRKHGFSRTDEEASVHMYEHEIQGIDEIPMNGSIDKMTIQIAAIVGAYGITYLMIFGLCQLIPSMSGVITGFNFLFGVLAATLIKLVLKMLRKSKVMHRQYLNDFLMNRMSSFFFDLMIVAGMAAIRLDIIGQYWWILLILGAVGAVSTFIYVYFIAKKLFPEYKNEQFLVMYGMLTGTASTGIILLRELDPDFETPAADNLVYQNFPAIAFGFPMMLLAALAPEKPYLTYAILVVFFIGMNLLLFRSRIFAKKKSASEAASAEKDE